MPFLGAPLDSSLEGTYEVACLALLSQMWKLGQSGGVGEVGAPAGQGAGEEAGWRGLEKGFAFGEGAGRRGLDKAASVMGAVTLVVARNQGRTEPRMRGGVRLSA